MSERQPGALEQAVAQADVSFAAFSEIASAWLGEALRQAAADEAADEAAFGPASEHAYEDAGEDADENGDGIAQQGGGDDIVVA